MHQTDLSNYSNHPYNPGGNALKKVLWFYTNAIFLKTSLVPVSAFKVFLLRLFGAKVGKNVNIKPCINIKYPWLLAVGDNTWLGEDVWIDNLAMVTIGSNACVSQGALLLTGSHNYKKTSFNLITGSITLQDGVWIGAKAVVNQGITAHTHAVLSTGSIATKDLEAYSIYQGNPAVKIRERVIS